MNEEKEKFYFLRSKVETRLERIANVLFLNASFIDNLGLLNGKMGIAIFFYFYARKTKNEIFQNYAGELVDEIYNEINTKTPVYFEDGLAGIGWGIEYLVENGFLNDDNDEALMEIDEIIYKSVQTSDLFKSANSFLTCSMYYLTRANRERATYNNSSLLKRRREIENIIDMCKRVIIDKESIDANLFSINLKIYNSIIWFLFELQKFGLYPIKVKSLFQKLLLDNNIIFLQSESWADKFIYWNILKNINQFINEAGISQNFKTIENDQDNCFNNIKYDDSIVDDFICYTWNKLIYLTYIKNEYLSPKVMEKIFKIIDDEENWGHRLDILNKDNMGLNGIAGLGLGLMKESFYIQRN